MTNPCAVAECDKRPERWITDTRGDAHARHHVCYLHGREWDQWFAAPERIREARPLPVLRAEIPELPDVIVTCSESGCGRAPKARGLCSTHYEIARKSAALDEHPVLNVVASEGARARWTETTRETVRTMEVDVPARAAVTEPESPREPAMLVRVPEPSPDWAAMTNDLERRVEAARLLDSMDDNETVDIFLYCGGAKLMTAPPDDVATERGVPSDWLHAEVLAVLREMAPIVADRIRDRLRALAHNPEATGRPATPPLWARWLAVKALIVATGGPVAGPWRVSSPLRGEVDEDDFHLFGRNGWLADVGNGLHWPADVRLPKGTT